MLANLAYLGLARCYVAVCVCGLSQPISNLAGELALATYNAGRRAFVSLNEPVYFSTKKHLNHLVTQLAYLFSDADGLPLHYVYVVTRLAKLASWHIRNSSQVSFGLNCSTQANAIACVLP